MSDDSYDSLIHPAGASCEVKTLYGAVDDCGDYNWVADAPLELSATAKAEFEAPAIRVYKVHDTSLKLAGMSPLQIHKVDIRSPYILEHLAPILSEYGMALVGKKVVEFMPPFKSLYFAYDEILQLHENLEPGTARAHLTLLVGLMQDLLGNTVKELSGLRMLGVMSFDLLWSIYPKGTIVLSFDKGQPQLYEVRDTGYDVDSCGNRQFAIRCQIIQHDGTHYGFVFQKLTISEFEGNLKINSLPTHPLSFHADTSLKERLVHRGKQLLQFQGIAYRTYIGVAWDEGNDNKRIHVGHSTMFIVLSRSL
jgi:hypothetical protein